MSTATHITAAEINAKAQTLGPAPVPTRKAVASYSWHTTKSSTSPKIYVPGYPPELLSAALFKSLKNDQNTLEIVDENHLRMPKTTVLPIFAAIQLGQPSFKWEGVQVVTDRNNVRKLARLLDLSESKFGDSEFRILAERSRDCVVLTRVEPADLANPVGYGHSFEESLTQSSAPASIRSQVGTYRRIVDISLASDFRILVRSECDAVLLTKGKADEVEALTSQLSQLSISWKKFEDSQLEHMQAGSHTVNATEAAELKTKNGNYRHEFPWKDTALQMFFGNVQELVVGWHNRGNVTQIERLSFGQVLAKAGCTESEFRIKIQQLTTLLRKVVGHVSAPGKVYELSYHPSRGKVLTVNRQDQADSTLNDDIVKILAAESTK